MLAGPKALLSCRPVGASNIASFPQVALLGHRQEEPSPRTGEWFGHTQSSVSLLPPSLCDLFCLVRDCTEMAFQRMRLGAGCRCSNMSDISMIHMLWRRGKWPSNNLDGDFIEDRTWGKAGQRIPGIEGKK